MLTTLAISNYRSALELVLPLGPLNLITGANGSGKSNLYRALRLLAATAQDDVIAALASEGGLESTFWAGPETLSTAMRKGLVPVEGGPRQHSRRLKLGFRLSDRAGPAATGQHHRLQPGPGDQAGNYLGRRRLSPGGGAGGPAWPTGESPCR